MEDDSIENFLKNNKIFPCLLVPNKDEIKTNFNCFNEISNDKINNSEENFFRIKRYKNESNFQIIEEASLSKNIKYLKEEFNINTFTTPKEKKEDLNINTFTTPKEKKKIPKNIIIGKYKTYAFSINERDISFNDDYTKRFEKIAQDNSTDEQKVKYLEDIFKEIGFYIPLKAYIGGYFYNSFNSPNINAAQLKNRKTITSKASITNFDDFFNNQGDIKDTHMKFVKQIFSDTRTISKGGDDSIVDFDKWKKSIKLSNSQVVQYTNLIEATNLLSPNLKHLLKVPIQIIEKKYRKRKKYFDLIELYKNTKLNSLKGQDGIVCGKVLECNDPDEVEIYCKKFFVLEIGQFLRHRVKEISESFNDIIIGFRINSCWNDGTNGTWTLEEDPLFKTKIKVKFVSKLFRGERFELEVYLMKYPN